jgi:diguanylate cyclase (GGDEF)-like protein
VQIFSNIAQCLLVMGVSFVVLTLIASFYRFQNIARRAGEAGNAIDPHNAFQALIANRLGTAHLEPEPFLVIALAPDSLPPLTGSQDDQEGKELLDGILMRIQQSLRGSDTAAHIGNGRIGAIVDAARKDAENIAQRLLDEVPKEPIACASGHTANISVCAGIATYPENGSRVKTIMENTMASLQAAVLKGHGQFVVTAIEGIPRPFVPPPAPGAGYRYPAAVDPLTGVLRSERLNTALHKYFAMYRKREAPVSIVVLEVDHFEQYGEHYGPSAGDEILRRLGELLQNAVRESDLIGRSREETFVIAIGCAPRDAMIAAQRIIGAVKKTAFPAGGTSLRITLSLGVAGCPDHGGHPLHLMEAATAALQAAKENGRNMCLMYEPSMRMSKNKPGPANEF